MSSVLINPGNSTSRLKGHVLTANFEAFVDDVISGKIDRKVLREMPQRLEDVQDWIRHEFGEIEETLERNIEGIQDTQTLLHKNQLEFSLNLISHVEMVQKIGEAAISVKQAADTVKDMTFSLIQSFYYGKLPPQHIELLQRQRLFINGDDKP